MNESKVLIAEPDVIFHGALLENEVDETSIYLGELSAAATEHLNHLLAENEIRPLEASDLKLKCQQLVDFVKKTQKNCLELESIYTQYTMAEKRTTCAVRKRSEFPDGFDSKTDNMRKDILRAENMVMESERNMESLEYQINSLEEERKLLAKEAARHPDEETIKKRRRDIEKEIDTELVEKQRIGLESRRLHRQLNDVSDRRDDLASQMEAADNLISLNMNQYEEIKSETQEIMNENLLLGTDLRKQKEALTNATSNLKNLIETQAHLKQSIEEISVDSTDLKAKDAKMNDKISALNEKLSKAKNTTQELADEEAKLRAEISKMELKIKHLEVERRILLESTKQVVKGGAAARKLTTRGNKKIKNLEETVKYLSETEKTRRDELELVKKSVSKGDVKEREKLREQISKLTKNILERNEFTQQEKEAVEALMHDETRLMTEVDSQKRLIAELHQAITLTALEASEKKRQLRKAQLLCTQVNRDLKLQLFYLNDHRKTLQSSQHQLVNFRKLYNALNVEKNECLMLINLAQRRKLMVEERCYFYTNELSILQSGLSNKQDQLDDIKERMKSVRNETISIRGDLSKEIHINREFEVSKKWLGKSIDRLTRDLAAEKTRISEVQGQCTAIGQKRDGIKKRLEELLHEINQAKKSLQEMEAKERTVQDALSDKTRELSCLLHENRTEARSVEVLQSKLLSMVAVEEELSQLKQQISNTHSEGEKLEKLAIDPDATFDSIHRIRPLGGSDLSLEELEKRERSLREGLSRKETDLQGKEAILAIVDDLVAKVAEKKDENREENLQLAKDYNSAYRANQAKETQMKATCAELRMKMFQSALLKRDLEDLQAGRAPNPRSLLANKDTLQLYTREIISRLNIHNADQVLPS